MSELERSPSGRKLQLRARALRQSETRQRITQAAVELHQQLGPLHTTITAIAQRAGVERLTVYRHFPDEASLHQACQQHFLAAHELPNLAPWREISTFPNRLEVGLADLYEYWDQTHEMFSSVLRDHEVDPERSGAGVITFMSHARDALLDGQDSNQELVQAVTSAARGACLFVDVPAGPWQPPAVASAAHFAYLAVPAHWQPLALANSLAPFPQSNFAGVVLTFTDISGAFAAALSVVLERRAGVAFLSCSRDVSTGIAVADPFTLASGIFTTPSGVIANGRLVASA